MSNVHIRLLFFFTAFPLLVGMVLVFPGRSHLLFNIVATAAMGVAAVEVGRIFRNRGVPLALPVCFILGVLAPAGTYLEISGLLPMEILPAAALVLFIVLFSLEIFKKSAEAFHDVLPKLSAYTFVFIYPGFFGSYIVRLSSLPHPEILLIVFVAATYFNDSAAWASGVLWGNGNRNILAVSPNKSLVGFIFGFLLSIVVLTAAKLLFPQVLPFGLPAAALFGAVLGATTILGDLVESAMKRSGTVKDSGQLVPGRGGFLDSIDSPLFNAPVFYHFFVLFSFGTLA